jgi:hypothetical protein
MQLRRIIGYLQKLLYTVKRIRMSPTPTLNIYLFEGPILFPSNLSQLTGINHNCKCIITYPDLLIIFSVQVDIKLVM